MKNFEEKLKEIEKDSREKYIPIIMDDTLEKIEEYIKNETNLLDENRKINILEIGTAVGFSAACFVKLFDFENVHVDTLERDEEMIKKARENFKDLEIEDKVTIYEGDAVETLKTMNGKYDLVFIDAAKSRYPEFLEESMRMLQDDGVIFADNVLYKGYVLSDYNKHKQRTAVRHLREFLQIISDETKYISETLEVGDGLSIIKKA